jgi:hypothetical protein
LVSEDLPPSRVCAPNLHVIGFSRALDVEGLVVVSGSDGQRLLMEVPDLGASSVWCLDDHVSVVDQVEVSVLLQLRDDVEIFLNYETKLIIHLSFAWLSLPFINIDDVPLLVKAVVSAVDSNVSVLLVNITNYFHDFASFINHIMILESEELPPSRVSSCASKIF